MHIIYYNGSDASEDGLNAYRKSLPQANIRQWLPGDQAPADYALVWKPPAEMLAGRSDLKAIISLGAGVDALLRIQEHLPANVPIVRLEDAGMAEQMADYVSYAVLRYFRRMDEYQKHADHAQWQPLAPRTKSQFPIAVLGLGVLGKAIAQRLQQLGFPVLGWSRSVKAELGLPNFSGEQGLADCLAQAQVAVAILPLTAETNRLLNRTTLSHLPRGAYLINVGRGAQVVEADLLELIRNGHLAGATLDVFHTEPLAADHPFWQEPNITITPHVSALTIVEQAQAQLAQKIQRIEQGLPITGIVDRHKGY